MDDQVLSKKADEEQKERSVITSCFEDARSNGRKHLRDICARLCACEEDEVNAFGDTEGIDFLCCDSNVSSIGLVTTHAQHDARRGRSLGLCVPTLFEIVPSIWLRNVVHQQDGVCPTIIARCDCTETLLSGCVPDLQRHVLSGKSKRF